MSTILDKPHMQLAILSRGYVVSRAIHALARLNVADHMSATHQPISAIAKASGTVPELLERILDFLTPYGLFDKAGEKYALTELSTPLQQDAPYSIKAVLNMVDDSWWQAFADLDKGLQTGIIPFKHQHGTDFFDFLQQNPEKQTNYDKGMARLSTFDDKAIADACDYNKFGNIIDLGGGRGGLSKALNQNFPDLKIILFDSKSVIKQLNPADFPSAITLQSGNFFKAVPSANAYLFKGVLHDFNDEQIKNILKICHKDMPKSASLIIAEQLIPEDNTPHPNKTMDIVMMVLLGGRQRTLKEWQALIEPQGFRLKTTYQTKSIFTVMQFVNS